MFTSSNLLSQIQACLNGESKNQSIDEALHLLRQYHDLNGPIRDVMSVSDDHEVQLLLGTWRDVVYALEDHLESIAYTWDKTEDPCSESTTTTVVDEILVCISQLYQHIATISSKYSDILEFDDGDDFSSNEEAIAERYLDWAIAAKRAGMMRECVNAHMKRMKELPALVQTDAIRLLGFHNNNENGNNSTISELTMTGLFESRLVTKGVDGCSYNANIPTDNAIQLGKRTANIFTNSNYTLRNCTELLQHALSSQDGEDSDKYNPKRIYSANSFFNHRREVMAIYDELEQSDDVKVLALLFLFGVSLKETQVEAALGHDNVQVLFESGILSRNQVDRTMVLGEVQIYPMSTDTFAGKGKHRSRPVYIMTDWSLESLRLPKNAIMSIGYDSLELIALAAGDDMFSPAIASPNKSRVLDLCCGCGIQGIFSAKRSKSWADSSINCELISMDINPRACHFVCANAVLNDLISEENTIYAIEADLFTPLHLHQEIQGVQADNFIGKVDMILSNPPFVAVPFANNPRLDSALYAAGGGYDGMHLVREIVNKSRMYLSGGNERPQLLMVTELPNVETSCILLETFIDDPKGIQINVAYIEDDVEQMEDYAKEREEEAGQQVIGRNWNPTTGVVKNRALVLVSISKDANCDTTKHGLFCFNEKADTPALVCDADEEDQFLTPKGMRFARRHLQIMPPKSEQTGRKAKNNRLSQVEKLEHDALLPYLSVSSPFSRHIKEHIEVEGYVVIPNVLSREECAVELSRLWDFVEATSPGVCRDDPNSWYPAPNNNSVIAPGEDGIAATAQSPDPWPHSGWGFLPDMCQSFGAGWLFGELREKLADRVFQPLFGTSQLHSSKEGLTFHRPTAPGVASNGAVHPFLDRERPRVAGKVQTKGRGEHFDQCAAHTGLQCIQSSTAFIDQDLDGGCFQCWPRSHIEHPRMTKDIWRGRSDWVPLTDEELISLEERGFSAKKVPVSAGDVILWRSDLVHCGVGPSMPRTGFRAVSYTAMIPAAMTPAHVLTEKIEHYHSMQTGDHRPNVTSRHFSAPKKTEKKHKKSSNQESESSHVRGSYFADGPPVLTVRQAELYGLIPYNRKDDLDVDQLLKSMRVRVAP